MKKKHICVNFPKSKNLGPRDWGKEILLALVPKKYSFKLLELKKNKKGGLQYHHKKNECGYLIKGKPTMPRKRFEKKNKPVDNVNAKWEKTPSPSESGYVDYINKQNKVKNTSEVLNTSGEENVFDKFANGDLELATAFWGFGVFGSIIVGVVCGVLSEVVGTFFNWVYLVVTLMIIQWLWSCAENHKKNMTQKKQPSVWGGLTQAYCVLSGLGLAAFVFELF